MRWSERANGLYGRAHRRTGGEPVVNEDHGLAEEFERRAPVPVERLAPGQFIFFFGDHESDVRGASPQVLDQLVIEHANAAAGDGAHRELAVSWHTKLADYEHVERRAERVGHGCGNGHTAPRESEYDDIRASRIGPQQPGELFARFSAITEWHVSLNEAGVHCHDAEQGACRGAGTSLAFASGNRAIGGP